MRSRPPKAAMTTPLIPAGKVHRLDAGNRSVCKSSCPPSRNSSYPCTCEKAIPRTVSEKRKALVWHCRLGRAGPSRNPSFARASGGPPPGKTAVPTGFLSDAERARLDNFPAQVVPIDIETHFTLSRADRRQIPRTASPANRQQINPYGKYRFEVEKGLKPRPLAPSPSAY
jgi:hypothetical protein